VVDRQVVVAEVRSQLVGLLEALARLVGESGLGTADRTRFVRDLLAERGGDGDRVEVRRHEERTRDAVGLVEQREQEVGWRHVRVSGGGGLSRGRLEGLAGLHGPALRVKGHD
jgi:hypothetical protein